MRVPLGVVSMIYEARPNVTIDASILCLKAGNAVLLRGGSEALRSNLALGSLLSEALAGAGLPAGAVQLIDVTDRAAVGHPVQDGRIRGCPHSARRRSPGAGCRRRGRHARAQAFHGRMPCVCGRRRGSSAGAGYRVQRQGPAAGVCNALECLLVHRTEAARFLPMVGERLGGAGVEFRACPRSLPLLGARAKPQTEDDLGREFHDLVLAVRVVENMDEALAHIARYGSRHTEIICTRDHVRAMRFLARGRRLPWWPSTPRRASMTADSSASARKIGISTSKLHAYGPMGVRELTTTKFVVFGQGQVRS